MNYVEYDITAKCNLNCKGCSHFCPLSKDDEFIDLETYRNDLRRLRKVMVVITKFRILGGEPLLHPHIEDILKITRCELPYSDIELVTNGLLLDKADFKLINDLNIKVTISDYKIMNLCKYLGKIKKLYIEDHDEFSNTCIRTDGSLNPLNMHKECDTDSKCISLYNGRLYVCPILRTLNRFSDYYGLDIKLDDDDISINIYEHNMTEINSFLNRDTVDGCRYCDFRKRKDSKFKWDISKKKISEWIK